MQGWNSVHPYFEGLINLGSPKLIIELGVWKGGSSIHMANVVKKLGLECEILSIDTWLGSSNHLSQSGRRAELKPKFGYPSVYTTFMNNVISAGHQEIITPLAMDGNSAAYALKRLGVKADLIHIDASHEYESCLSDLRNYWPLISDHGTLICDDYVSWPGVTKAVCEFAAEVDRPLFGSQPKAIIPKDPNTGFQFRMVGKKTYRRTS